MVVRLVEFITKPGGAEPLCHFFETEILPQLQTSPGFCTAMCLVLRPEPRIVVVWMLWQSRASAEQYFKQVFPTVAPAVWPRIDSVSMREFDVAAAAQLPLRVAA